MNIVIKRLDHIQICIPIGAEDEARDFIELAENTRDFSHEVSRLGFCLHTRHMSIYDLI